MNIIDYQGFALFSLFHAASSSVYFVNLLLHSFDASNGNKIVIASYAEHLWDTLNTYVTSANFILILKSFFAWLQTKLVDS